MHDDIRTSAEVDDIDLAVLRQLRVDSRLSIRRLAQAVGMSPGAIGERLERLEEKKVIIGYTADIDLVRLGLSLEVLIGVRLNARRSIQKIVRELSDLPGVTRVSVTTGRWDLLVQMRLQDHQELTQRLLDEVWNLKDIRDTETMIVLDSSTRDALDWI